MRALELYVKILLHGLKKNPSSVLQYTVITNAIKQKVL